MNKPTVKQLKEIFENASNSAFRASIGLFVVLEVLIVLVVSVPFFLMQRPPNFTAILGATFFTFILTIQWYIKEKDDAIKIKLRDEFNLEDY